MTVPTDPLARMRQLASNVTWRESLGKAVDIIVAFNDSGTSVPLYCVHSLSGKATDYGRLAMLLGPRQPFFAIQLPVQNRDETFGGALGQVSIPHIARHYVEALEQFQPDGPLALAGWSYGVIIALEMAQQLAARGRDIALLVAFDLAPLNVAAGTGGPTYKIDLARNALPWLMNHRLIKKRAFAQFGARMLLKRPAKAAPSEDRIENHVDPANYPPAHARLMQKLLDAAALYVPQTYGGRVQAYAAVSEVSFAAFAQMKRTWQAIAPNAHTLLVAGTHRSMIEEPDGRRMARHLAALLAR